jgi:mannose PTS system EIIA component
VSERVGILVVTHGESGRAMLEAVERLVGGDALDVFESVSITPGEPRGVIATRVQDAVRRLERGAGVLLLCDLYGSTPWSCCVEARGTAGAVLCGVSLPMLVKLASVPLDSTPSRLAQIGAETAVKAIRRGDGGNAP